MTTHDDVPDNLVSLSARRGNIRIFASVFVGLVCVSILVLHISFAWNGRNKDIEDAQTSAANLSRALAEHAEATLTSADAALFGLVQRLEIDGMSRDSLAHIYPLLASYVRELPQIQGFFVFDQTGKWMVNSMDDSPWMLNNADREYFIFHMFHADRGAHVGVPVKSRSTGNWVIPISRRINRPDGSFAGVVTATVEVEYFLKFYRSFDIGRHGEILLAARSGTLLAQWPPGASDVGTNIGDNDIVRQHAARNLRGVAVLRSPNDGLQRLYSYKRLDRYPLFVTSALSYDEVLSGWRMETLLQSVGVLILVCMLTWIGRRLVDQIKLRTQAQHKLFSAREKLVEMNKTLQKMALEDGLTGVANRRQFDVTLANEFNRARRENSSLAILMIDVDYFKKYNDTYGHPAGDVCLQKIGKVIKMHRPGDLSARYGGEEFAVLLPHTDLAGAIAVAENICTEVRALAMEHSLNPTGIVTVSIGVQAAVPDKTLDALDLISAADKALYTAKSRGRNQVSAGTESPPSKPVQPVQSDTPVM